MQIANIILNDVQNGESGIVVSLWVSGCPHKCPGCHNTELWDYSYGQDIPIDQLKIIIQKMISAEGITRDLAILGGEPLDPSKRDEMAELLKHIKFVYPDKKIYLWTGYDYKDVKELECLKYVDVLIDGKFDITKRDLTLKLRGSSNQNIYYRKGRRLKKGGNKWHHILNGKRLIKRIMKRLEKLLLLLQMNMN